MRINIVDIVEYHEISICHSSGPIISIIGCLSIFTTWVNIDYYDHYGPFYYSYSGFGLLFGNVPFGLSNFVPLCIVILFIVLFVDLKNAKQGIGKKSIIFCVLIFFLVFFFNLSVNGSYETPYYKEYYYTGIGGDLAFLISICLVIICCKLENKIKPIITPAPVYYSQDYSQKTDDTELIHYCPECGCKLSENEAKGSICNYCGARLR